MVAEAMFLQTTVKKNAIQIPSLNRVRRNHQRLPPCLLIENASGPARLGGNIFAGAFPIKASDNTEVGPANGLGAIASRN